MVMYTAYILNHIPNKAINNNEVSAVKVELGVNYARIKIFGCEAYNYVEKQFRNRFDNKIKKMKFVGITNIGYKLFDLLSERYAIRC